MTVTLSSLLQGALPVLPVASGGTGGTTSTGSGAVVLATSPTLVTPVLGTPSSGTLTSCTGLPAAGVVGTAAVLGANTFTGEQSFLNSDWTVVAKGNINNATVTFTVSAGMKQSYTATGSTVTVATAGWPTTGHLGELLIEATNAGAYTHSWPTINWIKPDGTTTTSIATYLAANTGRTALQTSGIDYIALWSSDAGTTIYGKLI